MQANCLHMRYIVAPGLIRPIDYTFPTRQEYVFLERYLCSPTFWPEDVPYGNIKSSNKESLCKIIHAYLNANDHGGAPSHRDRSPHGSPKTTTRRVEVDVSDDHTQADKNKFFSKGTKF